VIRVPKHLGRLARAAGCIGSRANVRTKKGGVCFCKSLMEIKCAKLLEESPKVKRFAIEPFAIPYQVEANGRVWKKKYKPDFFVEFEDGTRQVFEIKPTSQRGWMLNKIKWAHAKKFLDSAGIGFSVIDEKALKGFV